MNIPRTRDAVVEFCIFFHREMAIAGHVFVILARHCNQYHVSGTYPGFRSGGGEVGTQLKGAPTSGGPETTLDIDTDNHLSFTFVYFPAYKPPIS